MFPDTPLVMVEDNKLLSEVAEHLNGCTVIGVDTESDSFYSYQERVCLLQISDFERDYVIDPLKVTDMSPLAEVFASEKTVKIFHGADYDIVCLKRDFGHEFSAVFDTLFGAQFLGLPKIGLGDLIGHYFGVYLDKAYQRHNWSLRPLQPEHIDYARGDTHWLMAIREIMMRELVSLDRLRHVEEECGLVVQREWQGRVFDSEGYQRMKGAAGLSDEELRILRQLYLYRDGYAKQRNRPSFKVLADPLMVKIARNQPGSRGALAKMLSSKSSVGRRHGDALLKCVQDGLEDEEPIGVPKKKGAAKASALPPEGSTRVRLHGRGAERVHLGLKTWRNQLVSSDDGLTPFMVASNGTLKKIAACCPQDLDELARVPDVRAWQVTDHGPAILKKLKALCKQENL
jgi:ribonuclease D